MKGKVGGVIDPRCAAADAAVEEKVQQDHRPVVARGGAAGTEHELRGQKPPQASAPEPFLDELEEHRIVPDEVEPKRRDVGKQCSRRREAQRQRRARIE